jgi:hypothetical protein
MVMQSNTLEVESKAMVGLQGLKQSGGIPVEEQSRDPYLTFA